MAAGLRMKQLEQFLLQVFIFYIVQMLRLNFVKSTLMSQFAHHKSMAGLRSFPGFGMLFRKCYNYIFEFRHIVNIIKNIQFVHCLL